MPESALLRQAIKPSDPLCCWSAPLSTIRSAGLPLALLSRHGLSCSAVFGRPVHQMAGTGSCRPVLARSDDACWRAWLGRAALCVSEADETFQLPPDLSRGPTTQRQPSRTAASQAKEAGGDHGGACVCQRMRSPSIALGGAAQVPIDASWICAVFAGFCGERYGNGAVRDGASAIAISREWRCPSAQDVAAIPTVVSDTLRMCMITTT